MTRLPLRSALRLFGLSFVLWILIGVFFFSQDAARIILWRQRASFSDEFFARMAGACISALLTPAVLWAGNQFRLERRNWLRMVGLHCLFAVVFATVQLAAETSIYLEASILTSFLAKSFSRAFVQMLAVGFHGNVVVYWLLIGAQASARYYKRYREQEKAALLLRVEAAELETQLTASRLGALKNQLQPHFLFNTLNAIVVLVRQGKNQHAEQMLTRLGDLLRAILDDAEAQEVPLRREIECLKLYLGIEKVRFGDRLETVFHVDPATLDAAVPHMSLQPLAENAVRHGVSRRAAAGCITLSAQRVNGALEIRIVDDGPGPDAEPGATRHEGVGLKNTRTRLRQLYGEAGTLIVEPASPCGAIVTVHIPFRTIKEAEPQRIELNGLSGADC
jgi:two-component system, LytTR family, sensor kinase